MLSAEVLLQSKELSFFMSSDTCMHVHTQTQKLPWSSFLEQPFWHGVAYLILLIILHSMYNFHFIDVKTKVERLTMLNTVNYSWQTQRQKKRDSTYFRIRHFQRQKPYFHSSFTPLTEHQFSSILLLHEHILDEYPDTTLKSSKIKKKIYCWVESHWPLVIIYFDLDKLIIHVAVWN